MKYCLNCKYEYHDSTCEEYKKKLKESAAEE